MIYLISGKARSGKNTLATYIEKELTKNGKKACQIELMRTIKGYAKDYFGWDGMDKTKPREFLQKFTTEIIREKLDKPLFNIDRLTEDIEILSNFFDSIIVPDVRLPIEIEELKKRFNNIITININRINYDDGMNIEERNHLTEIALDNYDNYNYKIVNDTLDKLMNDAEKIVREVEKL